MFTDIWCSDRLSCIMNWLWFSYHNRGKTCSSHYYNIRRKEIVSRGSLGVRGGNDHIGYRAESLTVYCTYFFRKGKLSNLY